MTLIFKKEEREIKMPLKRKLLIIFLSLATLFVSLVLFLEILENQKSIEKSESKRKHSHLLVNELRQNSDDLTRMARAYVATGEPHFRDSFQRILDIYSGKISRPKDYQNLYWDFISLTGQKIGENTKSVAFWTLVDAAGFAGGDLETLKKAENLFKDLFHLNEKAISIINDFYQNKKAKGNVKGLSERKTAINLLYSQGYHRIRQKIINFLKEFSDSVDRGVEEDISLYQSKNDRLVMILWIIAVFSFSLALVFLFSFKSPNTKAAESRE